MGLSERLKEIERKYYEELVKYYGKEEFNLTDEQIQDFLKRYDYSGTLMVRETIREQLYYIINKEATYSDYRKYCKEKEK